MICPITCIRHTHGDCLRQIPASSANIMSDEQQRHDHYQPTHVISLAGISVLQVASALDACRCRCHCNDDICLTPSVTSSAVVSCGHILACCLQAGSTHSCCPRPSCNSCCSACRTTCHLPAVTTCLLASETSALIPHQHNR